MENREIESLQRTTRAYSDTASWLSRSIVGILCMIMGYVMYFKFTSLAPLQDDIMVTLSLLLVVGMNIIPEYIDRALMRKNLGYVKQKDSPESKAQIVWRKISPFYFIVCFIIALITEDRIPLHDSMFVIIGIMILISALIGRSKANIYAGVCLAVWVVIWIWPLKHLFHAHEMAPWGIIFMTLGISGIISGFIYHFKYKNIIKQIKGTTQ